MRKYPRDRQSEDTQFFCMCVGCYSFSAWSVQGTNISSRLEMESIILFEWAIKHKSPSKSLKAHVDWVQDPYDFGEKLGSLMESPSTSFHHRTVTTPNERGSYFSRLNTAMETD